MKLVTVWTGYINYYILPNSSQVKTHHFKDISEERVNELILQFQGKAYRYVGISKTKNEKVVL